MSGYEQWIADIERRTREIVREEIARCRVMLPSGYIATGLYAGDEVKPKPKSDLERAAEIADKYTNYGDPIHDVAGKGEAYKAGFENCARSIADKIRRLAEQPSPDWRKIAEGLAVALGNIHAIQPLPGNTALNLWTERCEALAAYNAAVKETDQ